MTKLKRYLLVHLAKSLALAVPVALLGLGSIAFTDLNAVASAVAPGVTVFTAYWTTRFKAIKIALDKIKTPSADDLVDDLFDVDDVGS